MAREPAPILPLRLGLPLALLLALALAAAASWLDKRPSGHVWNALFWGAPFIILALARVRDWPAWATALALTGAVWACQAHEASLHRGANIPLGLALMASPLIIAGIALAIAGLRGRIAWAREEDQAQDAG